MTSKQSKPHDVQLGTDRKARKGSQIILLATTILGTALFLTGPRALAQSQPAASATQAIAFDIPPQSLASALEVFIRQSGWQISYSSAAVRGKRSSGVRGSLTSGAALEQLASGTGLSVRIGAPGSAALFDPTVASSGGDANGATVLESVVVPNGYEEARGSFEGYLAGLTATATKVGTVLPEVPQTINVIGREEINSRTATRLSETLRYTPGVTVESDGVDSRFDSISIRGFNTDNATWLDGMPYQAGSSLGSGNNWTIPQIDPFTLERVEVLKGPSSSLYGQLPPGGMVNQLSKRPRQEKATEIETSVDGYGKPSFAFDQTGPLNDSVSYRLVAKASEVGARVNEGKRKRFLVAPSITFDLGEGQLTLHGQMQRDRGGIEYSWLPAYGTLWDNPNGRISRSLFTGDPSFNRYDRDQNILGYEYETPLTDSLTLRHAARWSQVKSNLNMLQSDLYWDDVAEWDGRTMERYAVKADGTINNIVTDTSLTWDVDSGQVRHRVVAGIDYAVSRFDASRFSGDAPSLDLYNPSYGGGGIGNFSLLSNIDSRLDQLGIYAQDQMEFGNWRVLAGIRQDWTHSQADIESARNDISNIDQSETATSGRIGLLYRFDNGIIPYVSYGTSFQPVVGATADGRPFEPMRGRQIEAGIRYAPSDDILLTAAVFDSRQTNRLTDDPVNGYPDQVQTGEVRIRGFEAEIKADLSGGKSVTAGYSYLDSKVTQSEIPEELGRSLLYTPRHQASLWFDYTVQEDTLEGWQFGAGARYVGASRGGDIETPSGYAGIKVPGYVLVDTRISAPLNDLHDGARLNFSVSNLFDKRYVSGCGSVWTCGYGYGRTIQLTFSTKF